MDVGRVALGAGAADLLAVEEPGIPGRSGSRRWRCPAQGEIDVEWRSEPLRRGRRLSSAAAERLVPGEEAGTRSIRPRRPRRRTPRSSRCPIFSGRTAPPAVDAGLAREGDD